MALRCGVQLGWVFVLVYIAFVRGKAGEELGGSELLRGGREWGWREGGRAFAF